MGRRRKEIYQPYCRFSPTKIVKMEVEDNSDENSRDSTNSIDPLQFSPSNMTNFKFVAVDQSNGESCDSANSFVDESSEFDGDPDKLCSESLWKVFLFLVQGYKTELLALSASFPSSSALKQHLEGIRKLEEYFCSHNQVGKTPLMTSYNLCLREFEKLLKDL